MYAHSSFSCSLIHAHILMHQLALARSRAAMAFLKTLGLYSIPTNQNPMMWTNADAVGGQCVVFAGCMLNLLAQTFLPMPNSAVKS